MVISVLMRHKKEKIMKKSMLLLVIMAALAACNTIHGAGQDIQGAGEWTSDSAQKVKQKIEQ
jgi:predicted small secreted protein